jgi:hypothetical protein
MKTIREVIGDCSGERIAWLEQRARVDPILAAWLHSWRRIEAAPTAGDFVGLVQCYATALEQAQAAALRAAQVRPVSLLVDCAATSCELRKALEGRASPPPSV